MRNLLPSFLVISILCGIWISAFASLPPGDSLGISPQDEAYYKSSLIKCKDGSKKFTREQLNDDFCDCPDGTDEPGTSACPEGKFYCKNVGHTPLTVFSSRVNDGICDCCDGSDEYDGRASCQNTCWEAGKEAREKLKKKIVTFQEGVVLRNQEVEKARQAFAKDEAELSKLKDEEKLLKGLVENLKEQKEQIEKAEEEERLKKEKEEKRLKEEAEKQAVKEKAPEDSQHGSAGDAHETGTEAANRETESSHDDEDESDYHTETENEAAKDHEELEFGNADDASIGRLTSTDLPGQDVVLKGGEDETSPKDQPNTHTEEQEHGSGSSEGLSKEELGRLVASRWTGEKPNEVGDDAKEERHEQEQDMPEPAEEENFDGFTSETEDDRHKYDDDFEDESDEEYGDHPEPTESYKSDEREDDHSDMGTSGSSSLLDKIQQTVQNVFQAFNFFKTPVNISEASRVREEYDDTSSKLSKIQSRISSLTGKLKHDFGKDKEFYSFYNKCFENKDGKYVYKVCPFKTASQIEGYRTTQLGRWDRFDESYRAMIFSNGDGCWNGPNRSLKVRLRCGLKNELADVDEPSRCEYVAILSTPLLCQEEKLKELQQKLNEMTLNQPSTHDEL